jgi:hypothetical protein
MPKVTPGIPDEIVLAKFGDREALCDELWLIPAQVGMLLGRSQDQLEEDRKVGNPPPAMRPWSESGPVRYRLGTVRDMMLGPASDEYKDTRAAREGLKQRKLIGFATFSDWLDGAKRADEWPFLLRRGKAPVDFWKSLSLSEVLALNEEDSCGWLNLDEYLLARQEAARIADAESQVAEYENIAAPGNDSFKRNRQLK